MFVREGVPLGGKELSIEIGRMAKQADGAVVVRYGDSMVLVTAVASAGVRLRRYQCLFRLALRDFRVGRANHMASAW